MASRSWKVLVKQGLNIPITNNVNIKTNFLLMMFGWGRAFLSIFSFSCCNPSWNQPCCLANQEHLNTFPHPVNRLVALPSLVQVQVLQLFPLAVLAKHLPLELQKDRKTKADQEPKKRVFSSNPTYLHNLWEFLQSHLVEFLLERPCKDQRTYPWTLFWSCSWMGQIFSIKDSNSLL